MSKDIKKSNAALQNEIIEDDPSYNDFEGVSSQDIAIPFLTILQDKSPQVERGNPKKIEGLEPGMIFETVNGRNFEKLTVIPCAFQKRYLEWVPREKGGGFVFSHTDESILKEASPGEKGRLFLPNGNEIVPTSLHFVLGLDGEDYFRGIISMSRTQRTVSKQWLGMMMSNRLTTANGISYTPRQCRYSYDLSTFLDNRNNNYFYAWKVSRPSLLTDGSLYQEALLFAKTFQEEKVDFKNSSNEDNGVI